MKVIAHIATTFNARPSMVSGWGIYIEREGDSSLLAKDGYAENDMAVAQAELRGLLRCIELLKIERDKGGIKEVEFLSGSRHLYAGVTSWMPAWKRNDWNRKRGETPKNVDFWIAIDEALTELGMPYAWTFNEPDSAEYAERFAALKPARSCADRAIYALHRDKTKAKKEKIKTGMPAAISSVVELLNLEVAVAAV